jgi:hypothetical protein
LEEIKSEEEINERHQMGKTHPRESLEITKKIINPAIPGINWSENMTTFFSSLDQ